MRSRLATTAALWASAVLLAAAFAFATVRTGG
jgi:hypothetical protein